MSAIANVVINDGQATPVAHTFYPVSLTPDATWRENLSSIPLVGQGVLKITLRADSGSGINRARVSLDLPALETATAANSSGYTAAPKVAYSNRAMMDFILPSRGTSAQRKDLRVLSMNVLANAHVVDVIDNLLLPY